MAGLNEKLRFWGQGLLKHAKENGWSRTNEKLFVHLTGLQAVRESKGWRLANPRGIKLRFALKNPPKYYEHLELAIAAAKQYLPAAKKK